MRSDTSSPPRRGTPIVLVLAAACPLLLALGYGFCVQDDAYISFRYARHLAEGQGLVYNPGERVEGFTNLLWTAGLGGAAWLGLDPVPLSVALGLASAVALVLVVGRAAGRELPAPVPLAALAAAAFAVGADPYLGLEAVQGLETASFALVVGACACAWLRERREAPRAVPASAVLGAVAFTLRPEGALVFAVLEAMALLPDPRAAARLRWRGWLLFAAVVAGVESFRIGYYGDPLPNTFYAKVGYTLEQWIRGIRYVAGFWRDHLALAALVTVGLARMVVDRSARALAPLAALVAVYLLYVSLVGGDFKPTHRFVVPMLGPLALLGALGASTLARRAPAAAWVAVALVVVELAAARGEVTWFAEKRAARHEAWERTARFLTAHYPPETRIAIHSAGTLPYLTPYPYLDLWGLTLPRAAPRDPVRMGTGTAGHERTAYRHVFGEVRPELYMVFAAPVTDEPRPGELRRPIPPELLEGYVGESAPFEGRWINYLRREDVRPDPPIPGVVHAPPRSP